MTKEELTNTKKQRARRRRRTRAAIYTLLLTLLLGAVVFVVALYLKNIEKQKKIEDLEAAILVEKANYDAVINSGSYIKKEDAEILINDAKLAGRNELKEDILGRFDDGQGILTILENVYSEKIVVPDAGGYYFYDPDEKLAMHGLDNNKFIYPVYNEEIGDYEGELSYNDEAVTTRKGVDVSKFQGDINWKKVKNDGIEFAMIRVGFRGYETGKIVEDEKFKDNIEGCNNNGIDAGVYFFTEAKNEAEGREEADFIIDLIKDYKINMPVVIDVEESANTSKSRTKNVTPEERTKIIIAFCERIKEAGYEPMIYGNLKSHMRMTDIYQLEDYSKWFAYYRTPLRYPYKMSIWQYTATGSVDGIKGDVDLNIAFY